MAGISGYAPLEQIEGPARKAHERVVTNSQSFQDGRFPNSRTSAQLIRRCGIC